MKNTSATLKTIQKGSLVIKKERNQAGSDVKEDVKNKKVKTSFDEQLLMHSRKTITEWQAGKKMDKTEQKEKNGNQVA